MPIFEYSCADCSHRFEELVRGSEKSACPMCGSEKLERLPSVFAAQVRGGADAPRAAAGPCGTCGDPRGPGACS
jgi:putative FmdB family regulatory protein